MKTVFKLCLVTSIRQLTPILVVILVAVLPFVFIEFTNYEVDPEVKEPALVQASWQVAWVLGLLWSLFYSAQTSAHIVQSRIGEYFKSVGIAGGSQLLGIWGSAMVYVLVIALIPVVVSLFIIMGSGEGHAGHSFVLLFQHLSFMILVFSGLNYMAAAIGSRLGPTIGYVGVLITGLAGIYFVPVLKKLVAGSDFFILDVIYTILPHYYLADLTHRFIHQQGALTTNEFFIVFEYLAGWSLIFSLLASLIFTPKEK